MNRITEADLGAVCKRINLATNSPTETYVKVGNEYVAQIGNYHIGFAYGGVSLHRMVNASGGISDVFGCGHTTKRDLYNRMHSFLAGLSAQAA